MQRRVRNCTVALISQAQLRKKAVNKQKRKSSKQTVSKVCRRVNAKYPKLRRLARNLLDKNKPESEQTEERSEPKASTRHKQES